MMIIHCADIHLDSPMESKLNKEKSHKRRDELLENFKEMVDYAREEKVEIIMIAGDMFDDVKKSMRVKTKKYILELIRKNKEIDFLYLKGNHDMNDFLENEEIPENLKLFEEEWKSYRYGNVVITGVELIKNNKNIFKKLSLNYEDCNIVMLHGQIDKSVNKKDKAEVIYINELKNKNIDYLALGHIHKREEEKLDNRGIYAYCGCLEGRSFDECGEKGFILLDIDDGKIERKFIKHSKRTIHQIEIDVEKIETQNQLEEEIDKKIKEIPSTDMVRVVLKGICEVDEVGEGIETFLDIQRIENKYDSFFYFEVKNETKVIIKWEKFKNDMSLKGEFVRLVNEEELSEEEKNEICLTGIKAIYGGEL